MDTENIVVAGTVMTLLMLTAGCSKEDAAPENAESRIVGDCWTNPVKNLDCECYIEASANPKYANINNTIDEIAKVTPAEANAAHPVFGQGDIDAMLALTDEIEDTCAK